MPGRRQRMRRIREVLRYRFENKMSLNAIAGALGISKGSVFNILDSFSKSGLSWPLADSVTDSALEACIYGAAQTAAGSAAGQRVDLEYVRRELARPHVTLELLWREYRDSRADGMSRATFYRRCAEALPQMQVDMKMVHKGGDKLFVDYSGDGLFYIERSSGEMMELQLFVACWGASSFCFAEARATQKAADFCLCHVSAFDYFGCVPHALVPDNLKSGVKKPCRYEPQINPLYEKLAQHYSLAILPARIRQPQDKAPVESAVGFVQRYILGRLRNRHFFSLQEVNAAIREELDRLNAEPMQGYGGRSRRQRFEEVDKPHAQPLPAQRFSITDVKYDVRVAPNYHVRYDEHFYSVPHALARQSVDIYLVGSTLEIYHDGVHLCRHLKQPDNFAYTTVDEHMPPNHRFVRGWSQQWFIDRAAQIGIGVAEVARLIMKRRRHPQQGFNSVMGLLNLVKLYTPARVEAAARRALRFHSASYGSIRHILENNLDKEQTSQLRLNLGVVEHENVRGATYFQNTQQAHG